MSNNIFAMNDDALPSHRVINSASFGQLEPLLEALKDGGDPNYVRVDIAPSLITCMRGYIDCFKALMENGARADIGNKKGWTALHEAAQKDDTEFLEVIYDHPIQTRVRAKDHNGLTSLRAAMLMDRFENADFILSKSPNLLESDDNDGVRPILWAAMNRKEEWLEWCLKNGADPNYVNESGQSVAIECASWERGADILSDHAFTAAMLKEEVKSTTSKVEEEKPQEEEKANPFGFGTIKKKR